jgi:hypothetical protein
MKKIVSVVEVEGEGLQALLGEKVILLCMNYFYAGVLEGVNDDFVKLSDPKIVYETGKWSDANWKDAQGLGVDALYVRIPSIESYARGK